MSRKIIANVPLIAISSNSYAYLNSFTAALYAAMQGLKEKWTYTELLMLSGAGNRLCWTEGKWVWGNEQLANCGSHPFEYQDRVLSAIGWKYKNFTIERDENGKITNMNEDEIKQDIMDSIERSMPILAQGLIKGDRRDYAVFYGYEDAGSTLIGWDYYQHNAELYLKENWITNLTGYVIFTEKVAPKSERERALDTFKAIAKHARQGEIRGKKVGFAAWEALAKQLEHDDFLKCSVHWSKDTPDNEHGINNLENRFSIYCDTLCQIVERARPIGEPLYFVSLIEKFPEWAEELTIATEAWQDCIDFCGNHGLGYSDEALERFRNPEVRNHLAFQIQCGMKKDIKAIEQIEKILAREKRTE